MVYAYFSFMFGIVWILQSLYNVFGSFWLSIATTKLKFWMYIFTWGCDICFCLIFMNLGLWRAFRGSHDSHQRLPMSSTCCSPWTTTSLLVAPSSLGVAIGSRKLWVEPKWIRNNHPIISYPCSLIVLGDGVPIITQKSQLIPTDWVLGTLLGSVY